MPKKPINPYMTLLSDIKEFCRKLKFAHRRVMWVYPKAKLGGEWNLKELWDRTAAAAQLDYEVILKATDDGLVVEYRKIIETPWQWR